MPKFEGKLTDEEIRQTVAYVLALSTRRRAGRRAAGARAVTRIPLFPLPGVVLLPGTLLPLHIFEPRYRAMVADALAGDRTIGMAMLKPGWERPAETTRRSTGRAAPGEIVESEELEDGRYNILLEGRFRYRVLEEDAAGALPRGPRRGDRARVPFAEPAEEARGSPAAAAPLRRDRRASSSCRRCPTEALVARAPRLRDRAAPALRAAGAAGASRDRLAPVALRDARRPDAGVAGPDRGSWRRSARPSSTLDEPRRSCRSSAAGTRSASCGRNWACASG